MLHISVGDIKWGRDVGRVSSFMHKRYQRSRVCVCVWKRCQEGGEEWVKGRGEEWTQRGRREGKRSEILSGSPAREEQQQQSEHLNRIGYRRWMEIREYMLTTARGQDEEGFLLILFGAANKQSTSENTYIWYIYKTPIHIYQIMPVFKEAAAGEGLNWQENWKTNLQRLLESCCILRFFLTFFPRESKQGKNVEKERGHLKLASDFKVICKELLLHAVLLFPQRLPLKTGYFFAPSATLLFACRISTSLCRPWGVGLVLLQPGLSRSALPKVQRAIHRLPEPPLIFPQQLHLGLRGKCEVS